MKFRASDQEIDCALTRLRPFRDIAEIPIRWQVPFAGPGWHLLWRGFVFVGDPRCLRVWGIGFVRDYYFPFELEPREWVGACCSMNLRSEPRGLLPNEINALTDPNAHLAALNAYELDAYLGALNSDKSAE